VVSDLGCPEGLRNFSAFRYRWRMPSIESGAATAAEFARGRRNMWYSFRLSSVHFVSISTESDFEHAPTEPDTWFGGGAGGGFGDQVSWLRRDLAKARADSRVRFIVVFGHRPMYATKTKDWPRDAPKRVQEAFEALFYEFGVDVYLGAHKHYYERTRPVYAGTLNASGTVHVVNGAAGNNEGVDHGTGVSDVVISANYADAGYGVLALEYGASGEPGLRWSYRLSKNGTLFDEFVLKPRQ